MSNKALDCTIGLAVCFLAGLGPYDNLVSEFMRWGGGLLVFGRLLQMAVLEPLGVKWFGLWRRFRDR